MDGTGFEPVSLLRAHSIIFHPRILTARSKRKGVLSSRTVHLELQHKIKQHKIKHDKQKWGSSGIEPE